MKYESRRHRPISNRAFAVRILNHVLIAAVIVTVSLAVGMICYVTIEHAGWEDAFMNSALLLTGIGTTETPRTAGGKLFVSLFALYSAFVLILVTGVLLAPVAHRLLHHFNHDEPVDETGARHDR